MHADVLEPNYQLSHSTDRIAWLVLVDHTKTQGPRISPLLIKNSEHFIGRNTYYPLGLKKEYVHLWFVHVVKIPTSSSYFNFF